MLQMQEEEEEEGCVNGGGEGLDALLADLAKVSNSRDRANKLFQWLIDPIPAKSFFRYGGQCVGGVRFFLTVCKCAFFIHRLILFLSPKGNVGEEAHSRSASESTLLQGAILHRGV